MASITALTAARVLQANSVKFLSPTNAARIFKIENKNTTHKLLQRLTNNGILTRIAKGKYTVAGSGLSDFDLANFAVKPSYISLESALNHYGILPQFPYNITSITTGRHILITIEGKEFEYSHLPAELFWGYFQKNDFIIASPEKALADWLYLASLGQRHVNLPELDLSRVNKPELESIIKNFNHPKLISFFSRQNLPW